MMKMIMFCLISSILKININIMFKKVLSAIKFVLKEMKTFLMGSKVKTFIWQAVDSFLLLILAGLEGINIIDAEVEDKVVLSVIISLLINLTKWGNKKIKSLRSGE